MVVGNAHTIATSDCSVIGGKNNQETSGSYNVVSGNGHVINTVKNSSVSGKSHTINTTDNSLIAGDTNSETDGLNNAIFGKSQTHLKDVICCLHYMALERL